MSNSCCGKTRNVCTVNRADILKNKFKICFHYLFYLFNFLNYLFCHYFLFFNVLCNVSISCCDLWKNDMRKMMLYISTAGRVLGVTLITSINTAED